MSDNSGASHPVRPILSLTPEDLGRLDAKTAVKYFRDLLWARAREKNIPVTKICISLDIYIPDGGVDASVLDLEPGLIESDELLSSGTRDLIP